MNPHSFIYRHIGTSEAEQKDMLKELGYTNKQDFIDSCIPTNLQTKKHTHKEAITEIELINELREIATKNKQFKSFIGQGYYNTYMPAVIQRNVFENPNWYTAYTPYQAEISQGRLESLFNFQTLIAKLTGLDFANASLLDEGTAAAEGMLLAKRVDRKNRHKFAIVQPIFTQTNTILNTRAAGLGIEIINLKQTSKIPSDCFGIYIQTPNAEGDIFPLSPTLEQCKKYDIISIVGTDLFANTLFQSPGNQGADIAIGSSQRFGIPMGFGGPHAAFFATKEIFKRQVPGRIVGLSKDQNEEPAYRLTLVTREQHIRREKATSNICTSQALLANLALFYAVWHGRDGIKKIAHDIHSKTVLLANIIKKEDHITLTTQHFFDTLTIQCNNKQTYKTIKQKALKNKCNFYYINKENKIRLSLDETSTHHDIEMIANIIGIKNNLKIKNVKQVPIKHSLSRNDYQLPTLFDHPKSEHWLLRWLKKLASKDYSLADGMIPLGSCTMKTNAAIYMQAISWPQFNQLHPYIPKNQYKGYQTVLTYLEKELCDITGMDALSLQPNAGANGEYAGLITIKKYHHYQHNPQRNIILIPDSAHGTNPASAKLAGFQVTHVKQTENGYIDITHLKEQINKHKPNIAGMMITYPSTYGIFEEEIKTIIDLIHNCGGLVYLDGANLNAQMGLTKAGELGFDVMHLNLHKTFAIPHGGGGPGVGPIAIKKHLTPYLPSKDITKEPLISAAPYGSALILLITYAYIRLMGSKGLKACTEHAIINANYIGSKLNKIGYSLPYKNKQKKNAHEVIIHLKEIKQKTGITEVDIAKRLMDYGFHAPTMSWPVPHTMMIEPTESETKEELDRLISTMHAIYNEINEYKNQIEKEYHPLKQAPFTTKEGLTEEWNYPFTKKKAYPLKKGFATVKRINDTFGDLNFCACT